MFDTVDFCCNVLIIGREASNSGEVGNSVIDLAFLDKKSRRFVVEPGQDEDDTSKHDVNRRWYRPGVIAVLVDVKTASPAGEVGKHDPEIHRAGKEARAQSSNSFGRDLRQVHWCHDSCLPNSEPRDEPARIYLTQSTIVCHEDNNSEYP